MGSLLGDFRWKESGSINGTGGEVGPAGPFVVSGCKSVTVSRGAPVGFYRIAFGSGDGIAANQCAIVATPRGVVLGDRYISVVHTSDTVKTFQVRDGAGLATDTDFDFVVVALVRPTF